MGTNFRIIDLGVILAGIGCMTVVLTAGFNSSNTAYRIKCQDISQTKYGSRNSHAEHGYIFHKAPPQKTFAYYQISDDHR